MKALELVANSRLELVERTVPEPGRGELRIAVAACGICGSDLHGMDGSSGRRRPPLVMGHEASGRIDAVGPELDGWKVGERVTFDSTVWCGECDWCREGRVNLCNRRQVVGVACDEFRRDGAFAEFVVVPARIVDRVPEGLGWAEAAFAEPVGVALHAVRRARPVEDRTVVVVGSGLIGLLIIQALKRDGAGRVVAVDRNPRRLELARQLGADLAVEPSDLEAGGFDLAFEVVGHEATLALAIDSLKRGGQLVLVGNLSPSVPLPLQAVVNREIELVGSCAICGEIPEGLAAIADGSIQVRPLISAELGLDQGVEAFDAAARPESLKVMIRPSAEEREDES